MTLDDDAVVDQLWRFVRPIINDCFKRMQPFLIQLGVGVDGLSLFYKDFHDSSDLLDFFQDQDAEGE